MRINCEKKLNQIAAVLVSTPITSKSIQQNSSKMADELFSCPDCNMSFLGHNIYHCGSRSPYPSTTACLAHLRERPFGCSGPTMSDIILQFPGLRMSQSPESWWNMMNSIALARGVPFRIRKDGDLDERYTVARRARASAMAEADAMAETLIASRRSGRHIHVADIGHGVPPITWSTATRAPSPTPELTALELAGQLEKAIVSEAKRRIEKEKADEETRIRAEAKRRLEEERAAAASRRANDVETRIQAVMQQMRNQ